MAILMTHHTPLCVLVGGCSMYNIDGTIPTEYGLLTTLIQSQIFRTWNIGGAIPTQIGQLTALTKLMFDKTGMSGSIPNQIANLSQMKDLRLCT